MTKEELVRFLENNYEDDEQLVWQVMTKGDVEATTYNDIDDEAWERFVETVDNDTSLADELSYKVVSFFEDWNGSDTGDDE